MALTDLIPGSSGAAQAAASSKFNPINQIVSGRAMLDTLADKFILKPANAKGLAGFVFDYEGETQIIAQSEITDHYSEQNTFVNDHAAQKPQRILLRGFVGELVDSPNAGVVGVINTLQSKLTTLPAILGKYTPGAVASIQRAATQATKVVNTIDNAIGRAQNALGLILGGAVAPTKQEKAYQAMVALWGNNTVFTLVTPFNYFRSVMIETMAFVQDEATTGWAEISVTVKEVRFAGVVVAGPGMSPALAAQTQAGRSAQQSEAQVNKGKTQGLFSSFGKVKGGF